MVAAAPLLLWPGSPRRPLRDWLRKGERSTPEGRWGRFLADVQAAEAGQRLVGLPSDDGPDSPKWAMGVLEREWSGPDPDGPPPGAPGPVLIELRLPEEDE